MATKTCFSQPLFVILVAAFLLDGRGSADETKTKITKPASEYRQLAMSYRMKRDDSIKDKDELRLKLGRTGKTLIDLLLKHGASEEDLLKHMGTPSSRLFSPSVPQENAEHAYLYFGDRAGRYMIITCKNGRVEKWTETETSDHD